jgi:hypothetical protein
MTAINICPCQPLADKASAAECSYEFDWNDLQVEDVEGCSDRWVDIVNLNVTSKIEVTRPKFMAPEITKEYSLK